MPAAGARAARDRAPFFAATLTGNEAAEEMFRGAAVVVVADNSVIVVGKTGSTRVPATGSAIKKTVTGATDVFVARSDAGLNPLLAATLVGSRRSGPEAGPRWSPAALKPLWRPVNDCLVRRMQRKHQSLARGVTRAARALASSSRRLRSSAHWVPTESRELRESLCIAST